MEIPVQKDAIAQSNNALNEAVENYIKARGSDTTHLETRRELAKHTDSLDAIYWQEVERIFIQALDSNPDNLHIENKKLLLVDFGLLDDRLITSKALELRGALSYEFTIEGKPNYFYFSQWMAERLKVYLASGEVTTTLSIGEKTTKLVEIYSRLRHLFENLPGVSAKLKEVFLSGQLDEAIQAVHPDERRGRLIELRSQIIMTAKEAARSEEELTLFDKLYPDQLKSVWSVKPTQITPAITLQQRKDFLKGEIKLVHSLLKLGIFGSGLMRTHSVLLSDKKRITKADLLTIYTKVREVDPAIPASPSLLIAPFIGNGFYEWDRNTIFVPLLSTRSEEESIVSALGNFRIMLDNLRDYGQLRRLYEHKFKVADFRSAFLKDYRNWVLGVGRGFKGAMDPERYQFFKEHIGPSPKDLFAERELTNLTPAQIAPIIKDCRAKINARKATFGDYYKLALCYWKKRLTGEAMEALAQAVRLSGANIRALYSLAYLLDLTDRKDKAKILYERIIDRATNTLWYSYAQDALAQIQ